MDPRLVSSRLDTGVTSALPQGTGVAPLPGPGHQLGGRYRLLDLLGQGGMGQVWRAHDVALDRQVAVKVLAAPDVPEARERFLREARAAATLNHPHIVAVHDLGAEDGRLFLVMELVAGGSLREHPQPSIVAAVEIARQLCTALAHAHSHGLVHRDVKPANVLVVAAGESPHVKLADLGLAVSAGATRLTVEGAIVGTVAYLAPEQAVGRSVDGRADLYSLGVLLYELVTGRLPFAGTPIALVSQHLHAPVVPPRSHRPELDPALEAAILRLLAKDPTQRYATAEEAAAALGGNLVSRPGQVLAAAPGELDALVRGRLIGRDAELDQLRGLWRRASAGGGQLALIGGEAGAGKTRLVRELAVYARLGGAAVVSGGCYEFEATTPYLPFVEALRRWVHEAPAGELSRTLGDQAAVLVRLAPELGTRLGPLAPAAELAPHEERLRLFDHVTRWLQALAAPRGALLLLDDLQWADQGTLQLLHYLLRHFGADRLLVLATFRAEEVGPEHPLGVTLAELNRERVGTRLHLGRLDLAATGEVLATLFGEGSLAEGLAAAVFRETEGNPFFVEETVKGLIDQGVISRRGNQWCCDGAIDIRVPEGVRSTIARRVERLSATCREALATAAALGKAFDFDDLAASGALDEETLLDALDEARSRQLVVEEGERFAFTHDKIREVLYAGMNPVRRRRLHLRIGEALLARHGDSVRDGHAEVLAHHFHEGGDHERGLTWAVAAAEQAKAVYAHDEALAYYRRAVANARVLGRAAEEAGLEEATAAVCFGAGLYEDAATHFERALELVTDARWRLILAAKLGEAHVQFGDPRGLPRLAEALAGLDAESEPLPRARALRSLARYQHLDGRHRHAIELLEETLALTEPTGTVPELVATFAWLAGAHQHLAELRRSNEWARRIVTLAEQRQVPAAAALGWEFLAENAVSAGRFRDAVGLAQRDREIGERTHAWTHIAWAEYALTAAYHGLGDLAAASAAAGRNAARAAQIGDRRVARLCDVIAAMVATDAGDPRAAELAAATLAAADASGLVGLSLEGRRAVAHHELWAGDPARVPALAGEVETLLAGRDARLTSLHLGPLHAEALVRLGRSEEALAVLAGALDLAAIAEAPFAHHCCLRVRALARAARGELDAAAGDLDAAVAGFEEIAAGTELARALAARATVRQRQGADGSADRERAVAILSAAGAAGALARLP